MDTTTKFSDPVPALCEIVCMTISKDGKTTFTFLVDHNTKEGRIRTAVAAREAMVTGKVFVTYPLGCRPSWLP